MSFDRLLLYLHILSVIVWMGAGLALVLLAFRARQVGEELKMIAQMEWLGPRVGGPAVIVTLLTGLGMVIRSAAWQFNQAWIIGGLVLLVLLFLVGIGFHAPQYGRIRAARQQYGDESAQVRRLIGRSFAAAQIEIVLLAIVVLLMVFKPGL